MFFCSRSANAGRVAGSQLAPMKSSWTPLLWMCWHQLGSKSTHVGNPFLVFLSLQYVIGSTSKSTSLPCLPFLSTKILRCRGDGVATETKCFLYAGDCVQQLGLLIKVLYWQVYVATTRPSQPTSCRRRKCSMDIGVVFCFAYICVCRDI